mmetsp:Transcript_3478/g.8401  ORF Transcript_3478/g.8401 Transcript_3478/m.8401 type:complete len:508 (+) Transcript_3478:423-1946(+)
MGGEAERLDANRDHIGQQQRERLLAAEARLRVVARPPGGDGGQQDEREVHDHVERLHARHALQHLGRAAERDVLPRHRAQEPREPQPDQDVDDLRARRVGDSHRAVASARDGHGLDGVWNLCADGDDEQAEEGGGHAQQLPPAGDDGGDEVREEGDPRERGEERERVPRRGGRVVRALGAGVPQHQLEGRHETLPQGAGGAQHAGERGAAGGRGGCARERRGDVERRELHRRDGQRVPQLRRLVRGHSRGDDSGYGGGGGADGVQWREARLVAPRLRGRRRLLLLLLDERALDARRAAEHVDAVELPHAGRADDDEHVDDVQPDHQPAVLDRRRPALQHEEEEEQRQRVRQHVAGEGAPLERERLARHQPADAGDDGEGDHAGADDRADAERRVLAAVLLGVREDRLDRRDCVDDDLRRGGAECHERGARHVLAHVPPHAEGLEADDEVTVGDHRDGVEAVQQEERLEQHARRRDMPIGGEVEGVEAQVVVGAGAVGGAEHTLADRG